jgi:hypothetical protein
LFLTNPGLKVGDRVKLENIVLILNVEGCEDNIATGHFLHVTL